MNTKKVFWMVLMALFACGAASAQVCTRCGSLLIVQPSSLNFNTQVGKSEVLTISIRAVGNFPVTGFRSIRAGSPAFRQGNSCPSTLAPGRNCSVRITFTPTEAGTYTGTLTIHSSAPLQTVSLSGVGVE